MLIETIYETKIYNTVKNTVPLKKNKAFDRDSKQYKLLSEIKQKLTHMNSNMQRARNREVKQDFDVSLDELWRIGEKQKWKCALTGVPLQFSRGGTFWRGRWCNIRSCSLDRIDSRKGYVKSNIQLVTWQVNCIKTDMENSEFIQMCKQVAWAHK